MTIERKTTANSGLAFIVKKINQKLNTSDGRKD